MKKLLLLPLFIITIYGQGQFSGVTYFDYTYDLTENAVNDAGFALKRVYFTYEQSLSEDISCKFQTDINYKTSPFNIYLKNAKIDWKLPGASFRKLTLGMQGMNIFNVIEKTWGFRFLQKSAMDKYGFSSSADIGIGYSGKLASNTLNYSFMYTNGSGYKNTENDKYKKISVQLVYGQKNLSKKNGFNIGTSFSIEPHDNGKKTLTTFYGGYASGRIRIGGEFDTYTDTAPYSFGGEIIAGYLTYKLSYNLETLVYIDMYTPNTSNGNTDLIVGINYRPRKGLTMTPNLRINTPDGGDSETLFMLNFEFKF